MTFLTCHFHDLPMWRNCFNWKVKNNYDYDLFQTTNFLRFFLPLNQTWCFLWVLISAATSLGVPFPRPSSMEKSFQSESKLIWLQSFRDHCFKVSRVIKSKYGDFFGFLFLQLLRVMGIFSGLESSLLFASDSFVLDRCVKYLADLIFICYLWLIVGDYKERHSTITRTE